MKKIIFKSFLLITSLIILTGLVSFSTVSDKELTDQEKKAASWVESLQLDDKKKEERLIKVVATHLTEIRTWHNEHHFSIVPAGINPRTGDKLSDLDRQIIADSTMPKEIHENLMNGLRSDLSEKQVEAILDKYTVGKVAFTMKAYREIVPDMTQGEDMHILENLKKAREIAVDYKSMKQISAIFEIYKMKNEQYLNNNGRNWRQMYSAYVKTLNKNKNR